MVAVLLCMKRGIYFVRSYELAKLQLTHTRYSLLIGVRFEGLKRE